MHYRIDNFEELLTAIQGRGDMTVSDAYKQLIAGNDQPGKFRYALGGTMNWGMKQPMWTAIWNAHKDGSLDKAEKSELPNLAKCWNVPHPKHLELLKSIEERYPTETFPFCDYALCTRLLHKL